MKNQTNYKPRQKSFCLFACFIQVYYDQKKYMDNISNFGPTVLFQVFANLGLEKSILDVKRHFLDLGGQCHFVLTTDYGLPMKPFFIEIPNFWADRFCGIWGIFGRIICTHFGTGSPLAIFIINQPLLLQKLSLYIHIPNIYLGLGFENFLKIF